MGTNLRTELSKSNPYYISKHRRLELTHFCLQYPEWKAYLIDIFNHGRQDEWSDPTAEEAIKRVVYKRNIDLVEACVKVSGPDIYDYLLWAVVYGYSYTLLATKYNIPCGKDYFYERLHKFFYILSQEKQTF